MKLEKLNYVIKFKNYEIDLLIEEKIYSSLYYKTKYFFDLELLKEKPINSVKNWGITYGNDIDNLDNLDLYEKVIIGSDVEDDIIYYFSKKMKQIFIFSDILTDDWIVQCVLRLIRNIFRLSAYENGELFLHGGMISKENIGIAIVGEKRSGKTTTILSCLKSGYNFISNDDISFDVISNQMIGYGWPRGIAVRGDSLKLITKSDDIKDYYDRLNHPGNLLISNSTFNGVEPNGLVFFQPNELVTTFGTQIISRHPLNMIVFPEFSDDKESYPVLTKLTDEEKKEKILSNIMDNPGKYNEFLLDSFDLVSTANIFENLQKALMDIPMFKMNVGFNKALEIPIVLNTVLN